MPPPWLSPSPLALPNFSIRLDPLEPRHAPDLFAAADKDLFQHSLQAPADWTLEGFQRDVAMIRALPGVVAYAIVSAQGPTAGRAIGRTTFMDITPAHRNLEIGRTWIARAHHGTRVNPEAKYLMLRHAFESLDPPAIRVQLTTNITNLHSQAAITRLGATREATLRHARLIPPNPALNRHTPEPRDWVYFSILDSEWPAAKSNLERRLSL